MLLRKVKLTAEVINANTYVRIESVLLCVATEQLDGRSWLEALRRRTLQCSTAKRRSHGFTTLDSPSVVEGAPSCVCGQVFVAPRETGKTKVARVWY